MLIPEAPSNEKERLQALIDTGLLDSLPEERFDRLTRMARYTFQTPIALVSLVDKERQWFKSRQGLDACETSRDISFCGHAILNEDIFVVEDTHEDARFADNPLVLGPPSIRFYAGAPVRAGAGLRVGTLCIIDFKPRAFSQEQRQALRDLADCVSDQLSDTLGKALQSERQRLSDIIAGTRIGTWEWNVQTGATIFNERWAEIVGYTLEELAPISIQTWMALAHPDDLKASGAALERCFNREAEFYDFEARMKHKDGHWVWVHDRGKVTRWTVDGKPLMMSGTHTDITDKKAAMLVIQDQAEFQSLILDNIPAFFFVKDSKFRIVAANKKFLELYPESQRNTVIGSSTFESYQSEEVEEFLREDRRAFETGSSEVEESILFPDGQRRILLTKKIRFTKHQGGAVLAWPGDRYHGLEGPRKPTR